MSSKQEDIRPKMLLHICCAPCSTYVVEVLKPDYDLTGYFYNPNIHPESEYLLREKDMIRYAKEIGLDLVCAEYDDKIWFEIIKGLEDMPEGGERCLLCFEMRLDETARYAEENDYHLFTTTLSISPHKDASKINEIGSEVADRYYQLEFYEADFKKRGGFEASIRMSKEFGLYRQSYCGCIFSKKEAEMRRKAR